MIKKRGAAHLEMVISFVFFISFVSILFIVLKPYDTGLMTGTVITGIEDSFREQVEVNFSEFFLKTDIINQPNKCFALKLPNGNFKYVITKDSKGYVFDIDDKKNINSRIKNKELNIESKKQTHAYKVFISPDLKEKGKDKCNILQPDEYQFGSIYERKIISYKRLKEMKKNYDEKYDKLRSDLHIPKIFDFSITSEELPGINMEKLIPDSNDLTVTERLYEVLDEEGKITNARFIFKVW